MTLQVARGPVVEGVHGLRWMLAERDWDTDVRFILKCENCHRVFNEATFTDNYPLGKVSSQLHRFRAQTDAPNNCEANRTRPEDANSPLSRLCCGTGTDG